MKEKTRCNFVILIRETKNLIIKRKGLPTRFKQNYILGFSFVLVEPYNIYLVLYKKRPRKEN